MEPSHLCMELRLGDNERRAGKLVEDTHTLAVGKELEALLRSPMGSGNEFFFSSPLSVFSVTGLNAHGPHKELILQREDVSNYEILKQSCKQLLPSFPPRSGSLEL